MPSIVATLVDLYVTKHYFLTLLGILVNSENDLVCGIASCSNEQVCSVHACLRANYGQLVACIATCHHCHMSHIQAMALGRMVAVFS